MTIHGKYIFFIAERITTELTPPIKLWNNVILRKPSKEELSLIRYQILSYANADVHNPYLAMSLLYHEFKEEEDNSKVKKRIENEENLYYWIIEIPKIEFYYFRLISNSLLLMESEINWLFGTNNFEFNEKNIPILNSIIGGMNRPYNVFTNIKNRHNLINLKKEDIEEFNFIIYNMMSHYNKQNFYFLKRSIENFDEINTFDDSSDLKIIGYSSILEMMLSDYKSSNKSISQQIKTKVNLINNQLSNPIKFSSIFRAPKETKNITIIEKLYQYRNDIAHGNPIDFENKYKIFVNHKQVLYCFHLIVKRIIKFGLNNPKFLYDLKYV